MSSEGKVSFTKQEAVQQMIEDALRLESQRRYASVVTLAGAAEEAMPDPPKEVNTAFREMTKVDAEFDGKPLGNFVRNWLKHWNKNEEKEVDFVNMVAIYMLIRVLDRYSIIYKDGKFDHMHKYIAFRIYEEINLLKKHLSTSCVSPAR